MIQVLGLVLVIVEIVLGFYVGAVCCLYGEIVAIISQIAIVVNGGEIVASVLAGAIVKIIIAGVAGLVSAFLLIVPGCGLMAQDD